MSDFNKELVFADVSEESFLKVRKAAKNNYIPIMQADTERLMRVLLRIKNPQNILEIGTSIGYSGCIMLLECKAAKLNTIEIDEAAVQTAKMNFKNCGVGSRATVFEGDAKEIVRKLSGGYDFIFMDGPKGQYLEFYPYLKDVLNSGGVLVCDNMLFKGIVENVPENKRHKQITIARNLNKFLNMICNDKSFKTTVFETGDGLSVSVKTE